MVWISDLAVAHLSVLRIIPRVAEIEGILGMATEYYVYLYIYQ